MCTKKYVISGLAAYKLNRRVMLEVNGAMYDLCMKMDHTLLRCGIAFE